MFELTGTDATARAGVLHTAHGSIPTPAFMPVGTHAAVNAVLPDQLVAHDAHILVCNAFRLYQQPGPSVLKGYDSVHRFMAWDGAILTDSGGFQVYSLKERELTEQGVRFPTPKGPVDWTPELAIDAQVLLGSDFVMPLDVCVSLPTTYDKAKAAMERTLRWAKRCQDHGGLRPYQVLFGIVQGATFPDLRARCIEELEAMGLPAYAIGGLNVGESPEEYRRTLEETSLPAHKPRYLMGVGRPEAMLEAVAAGVDIMDSIIPTKYAREGTVLTYRGRINLQKPNYARDRYPIDPNCTCYTCRSVTRGYLHHLFETTRSTAQAFAGLHNVAFCLRVMREAREAILDGRFDSYKAEIDRYYGRKG